MKPSQPSRPGGVLRALWTLCTPLKFEVLTPTDPGRSYRDRAPRGVPPKVDVYCPRGTGPHPSVVLVHGGGFLIGSRTLKPVRYLATRLVQAGFAVATPDYRLIFRGGRLDEAVDDVATALTWWRAQGARYNLDAERISVMGMSAGATLMWLALSRDELAVDRIVSLFGLYDFGWLSDRRSAWLRRRLLQSPDLASWQSRSPLSHALIDAPCLLVHGDADQMTPVSHAHDMKRARDRAGLSTTLDIVGGARHGFFNDAEDPVCEPCIARIVRFLDAR
ncbi:MAG: alpha/beta hydrolase [Myxococcota bacterium]